MAMRCEEVREMLPAYAGGPDATLSVRRHLAKCDACRAEADRYDALQSSLTAMRAESIVPPPHLLRSLLDIPEGRTSRVQDVRGHVIRNKNAYAGGLAVAAAGVAGAALWKSRSRRALHA
jgi:anti-sigma factor RsiW